MRQSLCRVERPAREDYVWHFPSLVCWLVSRAVSSAPTRVGSWKPAPDLFSTRGGYPWCRAQLLVAVVEDSALGVRAGIAAGMRVFAYRC